MAGLAPPPAITRPAPGDRPLLTLGRRPAVQDAPQQQPQIDLAIEVTADLPLADKIQMLQQLLTARYTRATASNFGRRYPPVILDLITLVKTNPQRPTGRYWDSVSALTIRSLPGSDQIAVEYCVEHCGFDPQTGAFDTRRQMVTYSAKATDVEKRINKKVQALQKFAR